MPEETPPVFVDVSESDFPIIIEFINEATDEVVHTIRADGPGAVVVPQLENIYGRVRVRATYADGKVDEHRV